MSEALAAIAFPFSPHQYDYSSVYKTPRGFTAMTAMYDYWLQRLNLPYHSLVVQTRFGPTHVLVTGPQGAPAVMLVHGQGGDAMDLRHQITDLSRSFRVFSIDVIGQSCKSAPVRLSTTNLDYGIWLLEVMSELKLPRAHFVSSSSGCCIIFQLSRIALSRISSLVMLNPYGFTPLTFSSPFGLQMAVWGLRYFPLTGALRKFIMYHLGPANLMNQEQIRQEVERLKIMRYHLQPALPFPLLAGSELKHLTAPVLLVVGQHNRFFNIPALVSRAGQLIPRLTVEVIPGAGYFLFEGMNGATSYSLLRFLHWAAFGQLPAPAPPPVPPPPPFPTNPVQALG